MNSCTSPCRAQPPRLSSRRSGDGEATLTVWLVDVTQQTALIPGTSSYAKDKASSGHGLLFGGFDDPDPYVHRAIRTALTQCLASFLLPYSPVQPK